MFGSSMTKSFILRLMLLWVNTYSTNLRLLQSVLWVPSTKRAVVHLIHGKIEDVLTLA